MKLIRFILPGILCLVLAVLSGPLAQANQSSANITLKVNIINLPSVITSRAIGVGTERATLNGILTSLGTASSANVSFGWDTESHTENADAYENWSLPMVMTSTGTFKAKIAYLNQETTYYFRAKAEGDGINYGSELSFTTNPRRPWWHWMEWLFSWLEG